MTESLTYNLRRSSYCLGIPNLQDALTFFEFEVQYPKTLFSFFSQSQSVELIGEGDSVLVNKTFSSLEVW